MQQYITGDVKTDLNIDLHEYQKLAKNFILNVPRCGLFLDMGLGKTLITLSALYELWCTNQLQGHILVIAPLNIAKATWTSEIKKWGFPFRMKSLVVNEKGKKLSKKKRLELYQQIPYEPQPTIYFINREMVTNLIDNPPIVNGYPTWYFQTVVIDELQSFKSYGSERFKSLKTILKAQGIRRLIGLTGTPTPNGLEDLWSEIYLMDDGMRLGQNITAYRNKWFVPGMLVNNHPVSYRPLPGAEEQIYQAIKDIVISLKNTELTLPALTFNNITAYMDDDALKRYKTLMKTNVIDLIDGTTIEAANAAVLTAKLSQMASGALYTNAKTHEYEAIHHAKIEQLQYIIDNTDSPVLVAYHFKSDADMIMKNIPNATIFSADKIDAWNRGEIPIMLLQPASAGCGINLQDGGHTLIWYTVSWSLEEYLQTNARVYRQGQKNPVIIHHILTEHTIDARILNKIGQKDTSEQALLDAVTATIDDII